MDQLREVYASSSDSEDNATPSVKKHCPECHPILVDELSVKQHTDQGMCTGERPCPPNTLTVCQSGNRNAQGYISLRKAARQLNNSGDGNQLLAQKDTASHTPPLSEYLSQHCGCDSRGKKVNEAARKCAMLLKGHSKAVTCLNWHPYNSTVLFSASYDGTVKLWDVRCSMPQESCITTYFFHREAIRSAKWIAHDSAVTGGFDKMANYCNLETAQIILSLKHSNPVSVVAVHPTNSNIVLTGNSVGEMQTWDLTSGKKIDSYSGSRGMILDAIFLKGGKEIVATTDIQRNATNQGIIVWDTISSAVLSSQIYFEPYTCPCLRVHPCQTTCLAQSNGNYIIEFHSQKPYKLVKHKRYEGHSVEGNSVGFDVSPDGRIICSGSSDGCVYFYDYHSTRLLTSFVISQLSITAVSWQAQQVSTVALSDWDANIYLVS